MEDESRLFVDANYFIALLNPADKLHGNAREIAGMLEREKRPLVISNLVFLEIVTILSQRGGKTVAIEGGKYLLLHPFIQQIHIDEWLHSESWRVFQEVSAKNISFIDCSTIAVMNAENIASLLTFDFTDFKTLRKKHHFEFFSV